MRHTAIQFIGLWAIVLSTTTISHAVEYAGGRGEPNDPYLIATIEQLLEADFSVPGTHFRLSNDIDLGRKALTPRRFRAHLDGAGFEIRSAISVIQYGGVFGTVDREAIIENLTLSDVDVGLAAWPNEVADYTSVGGLANENFGTISNCGVTGTVATWGIINAGGLVGYNAGSIVNCYFDGWVGTSWEYSNLENEFTVPRTGGLVSRNGGSVANSFSRGVVVGSSGVGGLVGCNEGKISNCYSTCTVIGDVGSGGLVSDNSNGAASLRRCFAMGQVMGEMRGGLVGMAGTYGGRATDCLWDGFLTDCEKSGAGIGAGLLSWIGFAYKGWAGDPNWVFLVDVEGSYPRLAWEGTPGEMIPQAPLPWELHEGSGTQDDPYVIRTVETLQFLWGSSIYWDKCFVLANDLDMERLYFHPIGVCPGSSFSGIFEGNGHVIRNIHNDRTASNPTTPLWNFGFFGHLTGEVRNLVLENVRLTGSTNSRFVGLLAGTCEGGVVTNCSVSGSISAGENSQYIGSLIGLNDSEHVSDCQAAVTVTVGEGSTDVGGLTGAGVPLQ